MMFIACVIVLSLTAIIQGEENETRLVPGPDRGRVEVLHNETWGTICSTGFDNVDAQVVCRSVGQPSEHAVAVVSRSMFGTGSGQILMNDVQCAGNESNIGNCSHQGWDPTNCNHNDDTGVICLTKNNILLNKPAVQSSTRMAKWVSKHANDGNWLSTASRTHANENPYWQGDLQGFYMVDSITVTSDGGKYLRNATIRVSDPTCPNGEMVECGRWPDEVLDYYFIKFNCTLTYPVRYVTIQREGGGLVLEVKEVHVEGTPSSISGGYYEEYESKKVTTPILSPTAASMRDCATKCNMKQPCLIFSYSPTQQPNCLLATDVGVETDPQWKSGSANMVKYRRQRRHLCGCDPKS